MPIKQYRPLSLLQHYLRFFDKALFSKIDDFVENNNILSDNQNFFREISKKF